VEAAASLNPLQRLNLLSSRGYAEVLFSEIESSLTDSGSGSPSLDYRLDLTSAQANLVHDDIAGLCAQVVWLLVSQRITPPETQCGSIYSTRVACGVADCACEGHRPKAKRGEAHPVGAPGFRLEN